MFSQGNTRSIRLNGRQVLNSIEKESWQTSVGKRETVFSTSRNGKYYRGSRTEDEKDQKQNILMTLKGQRCFG